MLNYIFPALLLFAGIFSACNDNNVEAPGSYNPPAAPAGGTLKAAGNALGLKMGVALSYEDINNAERSALMKSEFDNVTFSYQMKHGAIVLQDGSYNWDRTDNLLAWAKQNNLGVFGHTLVWHKNQNATYLNSVAAPPVTDFFGPNLVKNPTFDTDLTGWAQLNPNPGGACGIIHERVTDEVHSGAGALKVGTCDAVTAADYWRVQIRGDLSATLELGGKYVIEFWIKSSVTTTVQLETRESGGGNPQYMLFNATTDWTKISLNVTGKGTEDAIAFDLNSAEHATFHVDDVSVKQVFDGPPNMVKNPTFDTDLTGWAQLNPNPGGACGVIHERVTDEIHSGDGALKVGTCDAITAADYWRVQIRGDLAFVMTAGTEYIIEFWIKSSVATTVQLETRESGGGDPQYKTFNATTDWSKVTLMFTGKGTENAIAFDLNSAEHATFHIDDVSVKQYIPDTSGDGPSEEDIAKVDNAMQTWISAIVERYKNDVQAWDVVNEPMADGESGVRTSKNSDGGSDVFYWSDFLGRDYSLKAFQYAKAANPNALLFINDYNLESNPAKLDSLIAYVNELKEKGAKIDGIGTQMHIADTRSYGAVRDMFQKLAATGLLIKISELDVRATPTGATALTDGQSQLQAAMYQYVVKTYLEVVPKAQQYGITVWGVEDASSWLNNPPNKLYFPLLWDDAFKRKPTYDAVYDALSK